MLAKNVELKRWISIKEGYNNSLNNQNKQIQSEENIYVYNIEW
jgi:hypothetical protein